MFHSRRQVIKWDGRHQTICVRKTEKKISNSRFNSPESFSVSLSVSQTIFFYIANFVEGFACAENLIANLLVSQLSGFAHTDDETLFLTNPNNYRSIKQNLKRCQAKGKEILRNDAKVNSPRRADI